MTWVIKTNILFRMNDTLNKAQKKPKNGRKKELILEVSILKDKIGKLL